MAEVQKMQERFSAKPESIILKDLVDTGIRRMTLNA
jgi:hypothetical protein